MSILQAAASIFTHYPFWQLQTVWNLVCCHWQDGLSSCGLTDCRLGQRILAKALRKLLWHSGYRKGLIAELSQRSQNVTSYQWCSIHMPLQAARMIMSKVYGAQHTPKTHTIIANDLAIFLSRERRECSPFLEGACDWTMRVFNQQLNAPFFLLTVFRERDTEWLQLGSPLEDGEISMSSSITAETGAGSLEETLRVLTKKTADEGDAPPSTTLQPSSFSAPRWTARLLFRRWMLR